MDLKTFCQQLPKIELHAHLNGSLSKKTLIELGCLTSSATEYNLIENPKRTLEECFKLFKIAHDLTSNQRAVYKATKDVIEEFACDNVIYLELRTTPRSAPNMTKEEYIESVVRAINDHNGGKIIVKLLLSIDRRNDTETSRKTMAIIVKMKEKYPEIIKGVDLSGNPSLGTFDKELFMTARKNQLAVSLHCGEIKNDSEVLEMLMFKPECIGHGTSLHPDYGGSKHIWETYLQYPVPIECCLTSNVVCRTSSSYKKHHLQEWLKNGLPFSLNTDDKGVFNTTLSEEFIHAGESFDLAFKDLYLVSYNAIAHTFASPEEKSLLRGTLEDWIKQKQIF